jgi:hypothetical protein
MTIPAQKEKPRGSVIIKNKTVNPYIIEELWGYSLPSGESVDLCDENLAHYYSDFDAANRLVSELETAKLYQDIQDEKIEVVSVERIKGS